MLRYGGISKEVAGCGIRNDEGEGKFRTGYIVEKLKSQWKQVARSRSSVETLGWRGRRVTLTVKQACKGRDSLGVDYETPVYMKSFAIC